LEEGSLTEADREFMDEERYRQYTESFYKLADASGPLTPLSKQEYIKAMEESKQHGVQPDLAHTWSPPSPFE